MIVDEAHGAHFGFHPYFPGNSNTRGADLVVQSLHKTLPSLTQTALLHMKGSYVDRREVRRYLDMLQTSSPSYVLMASIDDCVCRLEEKGDDLWEPYGERLKWLRGEREKLKALEPVSYTHLDVYKRQVQPFSFFQIRRRPVLIFHFSLPALSAVPSLLWTVWNPFSCAGA